MFDIGFPELMLSAIVGLLVIGPERLPEALRTLGLWLGRMRRSFLSVKAEIEKEIGMDEVRKQLHSEAVMEEMKRIEQEVKATASAAEQAARVETINPPSPEAAPKERSAESLQGPPAASESPPEPGQAARTDTG